MSEDKAEEIKPQMRFKASMDGKEPIIYAACPHSYAWLESMGKHHISPTELHWVGKMGIEVVLITGNVREVRKKIGSDNINEKGILRGKFDMGAPYKVPKKGISENVT